MSAAVDYKKIFEAKRQKLLEIARNQKLNELSKRIIGYFVMFHEPGDLIEKSLSDLVDELNIKSECQTSQALTLLHDEGFIMKIIRGKSRAYKLLY
jgi:hypothetical protein